jgi:hypothetical protein
VPEYLARKGLAGLFLDSPNKSSVFPLSSFRFKHSFPIIRRVFNPTLVIAWVTASVAAAIAGPFGTYSQFGIESRLFYWVVIVGVSIFVGRAVRIAVEDALKNRSIWLVETVSLATMVPILAAIIWSISPKLVGLPHDTIPSAGRLLLYVFVIAAPVALLRRWWITSLAQPAPKVLESPRLLQRLPESVQGEVIRLTGQGHYVEVVTSCGVNTIRMRFADAIAEMEPVLGYCAHRSHWVTHAAISEVEREPGRIFLRLVNGDRIPVSRKYRADLEAAGIV